MEAGGTLQSPFVGTDAATPVLAHGDLASTNAEALRLGAAGETGPLWISAERQTGGRGRRGRIWMSEAGNLHASLLVTLWWPLTDLTRLSLLAGVALADTIADLAGGAGGVAARPQIRLKWPNDLQIDGAKSAGILVETTRGRGGATAAVIGLGVNVATAPPVADQPVTALARHDIGTTPAALLERLDVAFRRAFDDLQEGAGRERLRETWMAHAAPLGTRMTLRRADGSTQTGGFAGLSDEGSLLLEDETGCLRSISHGDVSASPQVV